MECAHHVINAQHIAPGPQASAPWDRAGREASSSEEIRTTRLLAASMRSSSPSASPAPTASPTPPMRPRMSTARMRPCPRPRRRSRSRSPTRPPSSTPLWARSLPVWQCGAQSRFASWVVYIVAVIDVRYPCRVPFVFLVMPLYCSRSFFSNRSREVLYL